MDELSNLSDEIGRLGVGDRTAFRSLYRKSVPVLYALVLRLLNDPAAAREVIQSTYTEVWVNADGLRHSSLSARGWLVSVARGQALERLRARRDSARTVDEFVDYLAVQPGDDPVLGWSRLTVEQAELLRCAYLDGETFDDLGDRLGITADAARGWVRRALASLSTAATGAVGDATLDGGEYFLGLSDGPDFEADPSVQEEALIWADRLAPLAGQLAPLEPPAGTFDSIEARLFPEGQKSLLAQLKVGQAVVGAALAAGLLLLWVTYGSGP